MPTTRTDWFIEIAAGALIVTFLGSIILAFVTGHWQWLIASIISGAILMAG